MSPRFSTLVAACVVIGFLLTGHKPARAQNATSQRGQPGDPSAYVPPDAGVINVTAAPYCAKGDGVADDTLAIQEALSDNVSNDFKRLGSYWGRHRIIYLPKGTYLISSPLRWCSTKGVYGCYVSFMGESRDRTVIKLQNNCPGYQDSANPRSMLFTASGSKDSPHCDAAGKGEGEEAYDADLCNFTVDAGSGNPGAIGIDYLGHNQACVRNVHIRSADGQGSTGLSMLRKWPGPLLVSNVRISGFDYGIRVGNSYGPVLEHISLSGQRIAGITNQNALLAVRDLTSVNSVPAITSRCEPDLARYSLLVLLDANLHGGASTQPAIQIQGVGNYVLRNVKTTGYKSALQNNGAWISGDSIAELVSDVVQPLFPSPGKTLGLPVKETPVYENNDPSDWVNVKDYGAVAGNPGNKDAAPAFQAAIDVGKPVVYVPWGSYVLGSTVKIRGKVRKIIGFGAELHPLKDASFKEGAPLFRVESNTVDTVLIEHLVFARNYWVKNEPGFANPLIEHASKAVLAMKDLNAGGAQVAFSNQPGAGPVFIENVSCNRMEFNNTQAWCRQLNPEEARKANSLHVINNGSKLWILGLKTESEGTIIRTVNNGFTEMLGGYQFLWNDSATPAFICTESSMSLSYITTNSFNYTDHVVETRDGITRTLTKADLPRRWKGSAVPLYAGYRPGNLPALSQPDAP